MKTMTSLSTGFLMSEFVNYTDRMLLSLFVSETAATQFYIATLVGKMTSLLSTPLNGVIAGHLVRYEGGFTRKLYAKVAAALTGLAVLIVIASVIGSHLFVWLFYNRHYEAVKSLFLLASAGQVLFFLSNTLMVVMLRFAPAKYQLYIGIIYTALFFAIILPSILNFGIWGAAWGLFAVNLIKFFLIIGFGFYAIHKGTKQERKQELK